MNFNSIEERIVLGVGAIVLALFAAFFGAFFAGRNWITQTRYMAQKSYVEEGAKFLDDLSTLIGSRFYTMRRLIWSMQEEDKNLKEREEDHRIAVKDWNVSFWRLRTQIRMLVGDERADELIDYKEDRSSPNPASLHFKFVKANDLLKKYRSGEPCEVELEHEMRKLGLECSYFIEKLTSEFIDRRRLLRMVKVKLSGEGTNALTIRRERWLISAQTRDQEADSK